MYAIRSYYDITKEIARFGGKIDDLVPPLVRARVLRKIAVGK